MDSCTKGGSAVFSDATDAARLFIAAIKACISADVAND